MEELVKRWENLMDDARQAYANARFEHSLELNRTALTLSKENFPKLFKTNAERAVASVVVSYFSAIDNCETLADFPKAQQLFNSALQFLHAEKVKPELTPDQQTAIYRGASQIYKEWCEFINAHNDEVSTAKRHAFQSSVNRLSSLQDSGYHLH